MEINQSARKVVIVGDQNVGKTSIIQRLIEHKFNSSVQPTIGTYTHTYSTTTSGGRQVTMKIWDTAGAEQYQALTGVYFRDSQAVIIIFDATKSSSVERVTEWMKKYKEVADDGFIAVAGNKSDLINDLSEAKAQCMEIESEIGLPVTLVSALNGDNITQLFKYVADNICESNLTTKSRLQLNQDESKCSC